MLIYVFRFLKEYAKKGVKLPLVQNDDILGLNGSLKDKYQEPCVLFEKRFGEKGWI